MKNRTCEMVSELAPTHSVALHCILIHGTFAPDASWTFPDKSLAKGLRHLDTGGVQFHRFRWSGENTHAGRHTASVELGSDLRDMAEKYPEARFLLIGHSHGGNVACAGVSALPESRCAGVVTLATPFFHVRKRDLSPAAVLPAILWVLISASFIGYGGSWIGEIATRTNSWLYGYWFNVVGNNLIYRIFSGVVAVAFMLYIGFFILLSASLIYSGTKHSLASRQDFHFRMWEHIRPVSTSVLCLSMSLDEAYWLLTWSRGLPERLHRVREWITKYIALVITLAAIPVGIAVTVAHIWENSAPIFSDAVAPTALLGLSWVSAIAYSGLVSLWLFTILATYLFQKFFYGLGGIEHYLMVNVRIRRIPKAANGNTVIQKNITLSWRQYMHEQFGLIHSKLYAEQRSIDDIITWYKMNHPTDLP